MMTLIWWGLVGLLLLLGFLGCFVSKIPGPIAVLIAVLLAKLGLDIGVTWGTVAVVAGLAIASIVLSKFLVKLIKKIHEFSRRGYWGTTIGSIVGLLIISCVPLDSVILLTIIGLVVVPFVFAFLLELTKKQPMSITLKSSAVATLTYLVDTFLKLLVFVISINYIFDMNLF